MVLISKKKYNSICQISNSNSFFSHVPHQGSPFPSQQIYEKSDSWNITLERTPSVSQYKSF